MTFEQVLEKCPDEIKYVINTGLWSIYRNENSYLIRSPTNVWLMQGKDFIPMDATTIGWQHWTQLYPSFLFSSSHA